MMSDLSAYAAMATQLAAMTADDDFTIRPSDLPDTLAAVTPFDGLVIDTSFVRSISWQGEDDQPFEMMDRSTGFDAFALPDGHRRIGLWLLHVLFSGRAWAGLELTHPISRARQFYLRILRPPQLPFGLQHDGGVQFSGYIYSPQEVWRHPFADHGMTPVHRIDPQDRPLFAFGWNDLQAGYRGEIPKADQIILEATPTGIAAMAALLVDMAHPTLGRDEINMEPPVIGFAATQPRSIEARFWLPGGAAFWGDDLDRLDLPPFR